MALSVAQMHKQFIGRKLAVTIKEGVEIACICHDARNAYGKENVLVQPLLGIGTFWSQIGNIRVVGDDWPAAKKTGDLAG